MKAVFNNSPIIFLTKLGIIEAAFDLFDRKKRSQKYDEKLK
jgi:hypothetical protein